MREQAATSSLGTSHIPHPFPPPLRQSLLTHLVVLRGPRALAVKGTVAGWAAGLEEVGRVVWPALLLPPEFVTAA